MLRSLSAALKAIPEENAKNFNRGVWIYGDHRLKYADYFSCGTQACAIGLASTLPDWKKAGLEIKSVGNDRWMPVWSGDVNLSAGANLLEMSLSDFYRLFLEGENRTPVEEADMIEKIIKKYEVKCENT